MRNEILKLQLIVLSQLVYLCVTLENEPELQHKHQSQQHEVQHQKQQQHSFSAQLQTLNLPEQHLIRYINSFPQLKDACQRDSGCSRSVIAKVAACWGHERNCSAAARFQTPTCPGDHTGWVQSKQAQLNTFYAQADFGYIQQQIDELTLMCEPTYLTDSALECTKYLRFCRGRNLLFDFRDLLERKELIRYQMDVLKQGQLAGHCKFNSSKLNAELDHLGALQSWAPEMRYFAELPQPVAFSKVCDVVVETPTFIMKIDSTYNMYHHFCDFFNLYASLFVNLSHPLAFHRDIRILIWETYPYDSPFAETFEAFTQHPVWTLNEVKGKRVCFKNVVLPLLPRMIFGLFYNTPIIFGCQNSGLFRAFSEFILHRLQIPFQQPLFQNVPKVRITFLSRRTKYRRVLNEEELLQEIESDERYQVRRISYESLAFRDQLAITRNTDILIGMHGAGLTHLLFLPNWASIFELYNCEDPNCYKDLARLRGVNYVTWMHKDLVHPQDAGHHPQGGAHAKFTNYDFDRKEFARLVRQASEHVLSHPDFLMHQEALLDENLSTHKDEL